MYQTEQRSSTTCIDQDQSLMLIQSSIMERFSPGNGDIQEGESYPAMVRKAHFQEL
jgi:hypothetical protein